MMKADVLSGLEKVLVSDGYDIDGEKSAEFPYRATGDVSPRYLEMEGWTVDGIPSFGQLPTNLHHFIRKIEDYVDAEVHMVSLGPDRKETVIKKS